MSKKLRIAVVGAGLMGSDHVERIARRIVGAEVSAVVDIDAARARTVADKAPGAVAVPGIEQVLADRLADAVVIATPGFLHEATLLQVLSEGLPILCEKPLTPDAQSSWRVVEAEVKLGRKLIQVGFMRRFDAEYRQLRELIATRRLGETLMLHFSHRNAATPASFTSQMLVNDSVVHEFDGIRFLTGEEIASVQVRLGRPTRHAHPGQHDPQQVLIETASGVLADVEIFVNARFGYQVATQAVFEDGIVNIGNDGGPYVRSAGQWGGSVTPTFVERFDAAFDLEVQTWVDAAHNGTIDGPSAWDGYATAACCEAGVAAQRSGEKVAVVLNDKPALYREA
ncbi:MULTISPECIES: Gfo/Idh/MocA family protein [Burkholderia cepacia complex]|uniref:Gfo/Idh/MocA family protein n=1 Tax=Burkholderia cepacia complex TaxID=87882 RepID=UPI0004D6FCF5|nr:MULTISPECIES: Gfo/Idh/MocA family oxidoreductase [Burkholderia cepacia complex]KER72352.1 inositol 2-dehydrogenase [Burkholderia cepacia]